MIDYFSYDGKGALPKYAPGVPGYGQKGAPGNTGDDGENVYYSSYIISNETDRANAEEKINTGKSLSNNALYNDGKNINYKVGDIVLDAEGIFYKIRYDDTTNLLKFSGEDTQVNINTNSSLTIDDFSVACVTSFKIKKTEVDPDLSNETNASDENIPDYDDNTLSWKIENPYYLGDYDNNSKSPYTAHKNYYSKYLYGNHIKFTIASKDPIDNCVFKYCLAFPSGEMISKMSNNMSETIFVDNRFVYDNIGDEAFSEYQYDIDSNGTLKDVKSIIEELGEEDRYIAIIASEYIKKYCKAYAEITTGSNTTYRIDIDDLFFKDGKVVEITDKDYTDTGRVDHTTPGKLSTNWKFPEYICGNEYFSSDINIDNDYVRYIDPERATVKPNKDKQDGYVPTFRKDFRQFNKFKFDKINCGYSKDAYEIKARYIFNGYVLGSSDRYVYNDSSSGEQEMLTNRIIRLYFNKLKSFTFIIKYNPVNDSNDPIYPNTTIYIGIPNIPLIKWDEGKPIVEQFKNIKDVTWNIDNIDSAGILYLNKIDPTANPSDTDIYTRTLDAGIAQVIINMENYPSVINKDADNFIDIGMISNNDDKSNHRNDYDISLYIYSMNDTPDDNVASVEKNKSITIDTGRIVTASDYPFTQNN